MKLFDEGNKNMVNESNFHMEIIDAVFKVTPDIIFVKNSDLKYIAASDSFVSFIGKSSKEDIIGKTDTEIFDNAPFSLTLENQERDLLNSGKDEDDFLNLLPQNKNHFCIYAKKHILRNKENNIIGIFGIIRETPEDYKEKHAYEQELRKKAEIDEMTGILNRSAITKKIRTFLSNDGKDGTHTLFMIDVDNFKSINDTKGHQEGDLLLTEIAKAIEKCFRTTDLVGRVGGDEFFVLMKNCPGNFVAENRAVSLIHSIEKVCEKYKELDVSASVGISLYPYNGKTLKELYKASDDALYRAKHSGKHTFAFAEEIKKLK